MNTDTNTETREPSRFPVRGTIAAAGTVGALALLLSFEGGPLATVGPATAANSEAATTDESVVAEATAEPATETSAAEAIIEPVTYTGDVVAIRWGDVQVAVTVEGDDIIDVETLAIPMDDRKSMRINNNAEPILREEAIASDSSDVSVVSGATYTSEAYATSLQSALDQLGI